MAEAQTYPHFKTEEGRARYLAAYEAALKAWPVVPPMMFTTSVLTKLPSMTKVPPGSFPVCGPAAS